MSSIPSELGLLHASLANLYLFNNLLTGTIPTELGLLTFVNDLELFNNSLTGSIPSELGRLSILNFLFLSNNRLSGTLPSELGTSPVIFDENKLSQEIYPVLLTSR